MRIYFLINARKVQLTESVLTITKGFLSQDCERCEKPYEGLNALTKHFYDPSRVKILQTNFIFRHIKHWSVFTKDFLEE